MRPHDYEDYAAQYTQTELANLFDVSFKTITNWSTATGHWPIFQCTFCEMRKARSEFVNQFRCKECDEKLKVGTASRRCVRCGEVKAMDEFYVKYGGTTITSECRQCSIERMEQNVRYDERESEYVQTLLRAAMTPISTEQGYCNIWARNHEGLLQGEEHGSVEESTSAGRGEIHWEGSAVSAG